MIVQFESAQFVRLYFVFETSAKAKLSLFSLLNGRNGSHGQRVQEAVAMVSKCDEEHVEQILDGK